MSLLITLLSKLKQPSSLAGLASLLTGALAYFKLDPELANNILAAISGLAGIILILVQEKSKPS